MLAERNVTCAASQLGVGQPILSARFARLRHLFDDPLFVPAAGGRGMVPTPRALALQDSPADALGLLRRMLCLPGSFDPMTSRRTFVVALQEQPAIALASALPAAVVASSPSIRLAFETPSRGIAAQLEDGHVDLLIAPPEQANGALIARRLLDDEFQTAQRRGYPRGEAPLDIDAFCALDHLVVSTDGGGFSGIVDRTLAGMGRARRVALSVQSYSLAPLLVAETDCVCTLPGRLLRRILSGIERFSPSLPLPPLTLMALWPARNHWYPGQLWLQ